jgi:cyclohexadienyl dehydratase
VGFRWPQLLASLAARRFDAAMSGITVTPQRSAAGRFSVPVAETGAVVLVRPAGRFRTLDQLDRPDVRIAVNAGGYLERATRRRFPRATHLVIPDNAAVLVALRDFQAHAAVTDTLEAPVWQRQLDDAELLGPFTRDRKALLLAPDEAELAADLDAWLLAREADGSLDRLRRRFFAGNPGPRTAAPLAALVAAVDERLALMPLVSVAKRRAARPIADPARERAVIEAGLAAVAAAAQRRRVDPPAEAAVRSFFRAQIDAAREVQMSVGRDPDYAPEEPLPDLETDLRPALLRIGEKIATLLVALPRGVEPAEVSRAAADGVRTAWLSPASRQLLAEAIVAVSHAPRPAASPQQPAPQ